jgi:hypothetical protein
VLPSLDAESAWAETLGTESEAALEPIGIDAEALDVDSGFGHFGLLRDQCAQR